MVIDYVAQPDATEELERKLHALGETAIGVEADVSKVEDIQRMIDTAVSNFGRLDVMVNNAGIETRTSVLDTTEGQFEKVMAVNLKSAFFGTQLAAKQMIAEGGGDASSTATGRRGRRWWHAAALRGGNAHVDVDGRARACHNICVVVLLCGAPINVDDERPGWTRQAEQCTDRRGERGYAAAAFGPATVRAT